MLVMQKYCRYCNKNNSKQWYQLEAGDYQCRSCYDRERKRKIPEKIKIWKHDYHQRHKAEINLKTREYHNQWSKNTYPRHQQRILAARRKYTLKRRNIILMKIGRGIIRCVRCGCDDRRILEINHKNGGGTFQRRNKIKQLKAFYDDIALGRRDINDLELLCKVCNAVHWIELKYGKMPIKVIWDQPPPK